MAEQPPKQQQEGGEKKPRPASMYEQASPAGDVLRMGSVPALAPMPLSEEEAMGQGRVLRPAAWVIADARSGSLEMQPARNNLARTYTLLGVAERLHQVVSAEVGKIRTLKDDVFSGSRLKAVAKMRVWYMRHMFHRLLRSHVDHFRRELDIMREVLGDFDARAIERETGGPTLHIMQELSSSGSASTSAPAAPPAASASGVHAPGAGESGDGKTTYNVEVEAGSIISSRMCATASAEEVAAGGASAEEVAAGGASAATSSHAARVREEATRPGWSAGRLKKKKAEGASSSSSGKSYDSLMSSASALQEPSPSNPEAIVVDTLLASLQESEASAASDAMDMLQRVFTQMLNEVTLHVAVADRILRHGQQRSLVMLGDDGEVEEQEESPPTPHRQLVLDLWLMHAQMCTTQGCLSWSVAKLQHILDKLPPTPSAVRLPPTPPRPPATPSPPPSPPRSPPSEDAGGHMSRFSLIFKKPFSRN